MSLPSSSAAYGSSTNSNGGPSDENAFSKFFDCWLAEQDQFLQELTAASKDHQNNNTGESTRAESYEDGVLRPLIRRVVEHYEEYYRTKSRWANHDVLAMLSPSWRSSLEDAFLWVGGWRPSMAFHLLYSKSGLQLEAGLWELVRGLSTGDLGDLSPGQLVRVDELQRRTIREEKELTEEMAKQQETVADTSMVELSHEVSEMMRAGEVGGFEERVQSALAPKEEGLDGVLQKADDLRLRTLKGVIEILDPTQAVHFLIAAAELHLRLHEWGKKRDESVQHHEAH